MYHTYSRLFIFNIIVLAAVSEVGRPHPCGRPCAFEEKQKHEITSIFLIVAHIKKEMKKENNSIFPWRSRRRWLLAVIVFSRFYPVKYPLQHRNHERYSWIYAVLMSAIRRYLFVENYP